MNTETEKQAQSYGDLLQRAEWLERRQDILRRDLYRCRNCRATGQLEVHHRQYHFLQRDNRYRMPWAYPDHLLITLCFDCHKAGHASYRIPVFNI